MPSVPTGPRTLPLPTTNPEGTSSAIQTQHNSTINPKAPLQQEVVDDTTSGVTTLTTTDLYKQEEPLTAEQLALYKAPYGMPLSILGATLEPCS